MKNTYVEKRMKKKMCNVAAIVAAALLFATVLSGTPTRAWANIDKGSLTEITSVAINNLPVYVDGEQNAYNVDGETVTPLENVKWNDSTNTLTMSGANIGTFSFNPDSSPIDETSNLDKATLLKSDKVDDEYGVTIELASGTKNTISGIKGVLNGIGVTCRGDLTITGAGELTVLGGSDDANMSNALGAWSLTVDGGAKVTVNIDFTITCNTTPDAVYIGGNLRINNGELNTNSEILAIWSVIVESAGTLNVDIQNYSDYCLVTNYAGAVEPSIIRGTVKLKNQSTKTAKMVADGSGLELCEGQGLIIDGGILDIEAINHGITNFIGDLEMRSGTVNIHARRGNGIIQYEDGYTLIFSGGNSTVQSDSAAAVVGKNFEMTGGRLRAIAANSENPYSIVSLGDLKLGEGVEIALPKSGKFGHYLENPDLMVLDENGEPAGEAIIETKQQPTPKKDDTAGGVQTSDSDSIIFYGIATILALLGMASAYGLKRKSGK